MSNRDTKRQQEGCLGSWVSGTSGLQSHRFQGSWINQRRRGLAEQSRVISALPLHFPDSLALHLKPTDQNSGSRALIRCPICLLLPQAGQDKPPPALSPAPDSVVKSNCCPVQTENCSVSARKSADSWVSIFLLKQPKKS